MWESLVGVFWSLLSVNIKDMLWDVSGSCDYIQGTSIQPQGEGLGQCVGGHERPVVLFHSPTCSVLFSCLFCLPFFPEGAHPFGCLKSAQWNHTTGFCTLRWEIRKCYFKHFLSSVIIYVIVIWWHIIGTVLYFVASKELHYSTFWWCFRKLVWSWHVMHYNFSYLK